MREFTKTSRAMAEVRGASPRAFSSRVTAEARYRKATDTRFSNLSKKKAAQGFLNAAEEKVFRHLKRVMRGRTRDPVGIAISIPFSAAESGI